MKKSKKLYSLVILLAFITGSIYASDEFTTKNAAYMITEPGYHKCELTEYTGDAERVVVPQTVNYEGQAYTITGIGFEAFNLNASVVTVELASTVDYIGPGAFADCYNLASINLNNVTIIGDNAFSNDQSLKDVVFSERLTSIGAKTFLGCIGFKSLKIPNSTTSISEEAFQGCENLSRVIFGNGMKTIGDNAFAACSALQSVSCHAPEPPQLGENTFDMEVTQNILLYIPTGTKDLYVESAWGEYFAFENIIEKGPAVTRSQTVEVAEEKAPKRTGEVKVSQKGNVVRVTLPEGASIEVYDEQNLLLETVKLIDGMLYNE